MTATEDSIPCENGAPIVVACEETMTPTPAVLKEAEAGTEMETETDQIDFVTLGMFIIGRSFSHR